MKDRLIYKLLIAVITEAVKAYYAGGTLIIEYLDDLYFVNINGEEYSVQGMFKEYDKPPRPLSLIESSLAFAIYSWSKYNGIYWNKAYKDSLLSQCSNETKYFGANKIFALTGQTIYF